MTETKKNWSNKVTQESDALNVKPGIFAGAPLQIASSLKKSAEASSRRKSSPFRSAMSKLTFYINRAGKKLSKAERQKLEETKEVLRKVFKVS